MALGRKNYFSVGSEAGGKANPITYTLIETAKLNAVDPNAWPTDNNLRPWTSSRQAKQQVVRSERLTVTSRK